MHRHDAGRTLPLLHLAKLNTPQLAVLQFVQMPRTVSTIADHIGLSRPATSQLVNKLVRRRLVRRSEGAADRREKRIVLGAHGAALLGRIDAARMARFQASLKVLSDRVAIRLAKSLALAVTAMERSGASSSDPVRS